MRPKKKKLVQILAFSPLMFLHVNAEELIYSNFSGDYKTPDYIQPGVSVATSGGLDQSLEFGSTDGNLE